jgi:putative hemin transport protein
MTSQAQAVHGHTAAAPAARPTPKRPIDQAAALGVSEGEWLTAHQSEAGVTRLRMPAADILRALPDLGVVMALTRNASCVHEKDGAYANIEVTGTMGLVLNHEIDLRLFLNHWAHGFAVQAPLDDGAIRHSLQFFDAAGVAIHKIFARPQTNMDAWRALVARFTAYGPLEPVVAVAPKPANPDRPDAEIDLDGLRDGWRKLADVHDFFALLRKKGVGRRQALRLAGAPFARRIPAESVRWLLEEAAARDLPIMCFVGNQACIQIHSGPVRKVVPMGPWLNVLDPGFNLHLRADQIADAFAVWKPQTDSAVHSIELFDSEGQLICQLFGERKPGRPELVGWKQLVAEVPSA